MTDQPQCESPRISRLKQALEAGVAAALPAFWKEVASTSAPLIEPLSDDPKRALVTFVWRAQGETRTVAVVGGLMGMDPTKSAMTRLADTDLWYRTYPAPMNLRSQYIFGPNDPLTPLSAAKDQKELEARLAALRPDPLNPLQIGLTGDDAPSGVRIVNSVLELPDAPPQPYIQKRAGAPEGKVNIHTVRSDILGNERKVWVYTPPGYSPDGLSCALLLAFDGEAYHSYVPTPTILDNLLAEGKIPPMIAVMPSNVDQATRSKELPCYAPHADFSAKELLPFVHERYNVTYDPALTYVGGSSYGGLAAAYTAFRYPRVFGNVLSQSGSYWWKPDGDEEQEWLAKQFAAARRKPLRFYMDVGLLETTTDHCPVSQLVSDRHLRDVLRAKGYPVHYVEYSGGHDYAVWRGTLSDGLLALLGMAGAH